MMRRTAAPFAVVVLLALYSAPATGDVILDGTLQPGNDGMVPFDESLPTDPPSYLIDQGLGITSGNGRNLLHSFREFSLADGESARFTGDATIENVITRVTGGLESIIEGVIRSEIGTANFFFVNPSGITFRNVAENNFENKIEVPGSFYASSADQLLFSGGEQFTSSGLGGTPPDQILSVPAAWEFLGGLAGGIEVDQTLPLGVTNGATLSLVGGDIRVHRGATIQANGGAIELAAVGGDAVQVPLALASWQPPDGSVGEIVVEGGATTGGSILRTNGAIGGRIVMRGGRLVVSDSSVLLATGDASAGIDAIDAIDLEFSESIVLDGGFVSPTNGTATGVGAVRIRTELLSISNGGGIRQRTGNGDAGTVEIEADQILIESGGAIESSAAIGSGRGGDILVSARDLELSSASSIRTLTNSSGRAGDIIVNADEAVRLGGASGIGSQSFAAGAAGDVTVAAIQTIDLIGGSEISSASETGSTGAGGDVLIAGSLDGTVAVGQFRLSEGAQIEVATFTDQAGGDLRVVADQIEIEGSANGGARPSGLFAQSAIGAGTGDAGSIRIESRTLEVAGGSGVSARSFGAGRSGRLEVLSTESVILRGTTDGVPNLSIRVIDGDAGGVATGEPGLVITTERLELHDGALVSASTLGAGEAGDVLIDAGSVLIRGQANGIGSSVFAESGGRQAGAGSSGRIELIVRDDLELAEGGRISVRTLGPGVSDRIDLQTGGDVRITGGSVVRSLAEGSGDAGDISLDMGGSLTIGSGASITAESLGSADAGEIRIAADLGIRGSGGRVTTAANAAGGGNITLEARRSIQLTESIILASVEGRAGEGDAGNVDLRANEIIVNDSEILAQATLGDGGRIQIAANRYLASAESLIDASSSAGIDGVVVVQAPDVSLRGELASLPSVILDPGGLLREPCAARATGLGSFAVLGSAGSPQTPLVAGSLRMPLPGGLDVEPMTGSESRSGEENRWFEANMAGLNGLRLCARLVGERP